MDKIKIIKIQSNSEHVTSSIKINKENQEQKNEIKDYISKLNLANCKSVSDFEKIEEIGEGTYGTVCMKF